ncbi:MAG: hypothetical protein WDN03_03960 [Rhizomicrobium sp.]
MADFVSKALAKSTTIIRLVFPKRGDHLRMAYSLFDERGRRKYLVPMERRTFLQAALDVGGETASFCAVMVFCGTRISEALAITPERIDDANGAINIRTLKRRALCDSAPSLCRANCSHILTAYIRYRDAQRDPTRAGSENMEIQPDNRLATHKVCHAQRCAPGVRLQAQIKNNRCDMHLEPKRR